MSVESFSTTASYFGEYDFEIKITNTGDSDWFDISACKSASAEVSGLESGGSLAFHTSNSKTKPAAADDGASGGQTAMATEDMFFLTSKLPARWGKVAKTEGGSPEETTILFHGLSR